MHIWTILWYMFENNPLRHLYACLLWEFYKQITRARLCICLWLFTHLVIRIWKRKQNSRYILCVLHILIYMYINKQAFIARLQYKIKNLFIYNSVYYIHNFYSIKTIFGHTRARAYWPYRREGSDGGRTFMGQVIYILFLDNGANYFF